MQHIIVYKLRIIAVEKLTYKYEILFKSVCEAAKSFQEFLIKTVCNIKSQTVNVKFLYPALDAGKNVLNDFVVP